MATSAVPALRALPIASSDGQTAKAGPISKADPWSLVPGILAAIKTPVFRNQSFSVIEYGADPSGRGSSNSLPAFTAAIAACNKAGGGIVVVPEGTYILNGPIHMLSNVNLHLEEGALIKFGTDPSYYLPVVEVRWGGIRCFNYSPLIYAFQQSNFAITGSGTFDGQADGHWDYFVPLEAQDSELLQEMAIDRVPVADRIFGEGHHLRPTMFEPYNCQTLQVEGVTFRGSPFWTMHPTFCQSVTISNVTVLPGTANDDGCDPDSCNGVLIEGCNFTTVDDSISIKAGMAPDSDRLPGTENVVIQNCKTVSTLWGAMTIGSNVSAGVSNVFVENYTAVDSLNAIYFKGNRNAGGFAQNIYLKNFTAGSTHHLMTLDPQAYGTDSQALAEPAFSEISLQSSLCSEASVSCFLFDGTSQSPIEEIVLSVVEIKSSPRLVMGAYANVQSYGLTCNDQPVTLSSI